MGSIPKKVITQHCIVFPILCSILIIYSIYSGVYYVSFNLPIDPSLYFTPC